MNSPAASSTKKPPTSATARACAAPRSRKASRPLRKSARRSSNGKNSGSPGPHRPNLLDIGIPRKRLVALAVDRIDRDAPLGIGVHAPAEALAKSRCPHARLPLGEEFVAGKASRLLRCLRIQLPAGGGGCEYHVVGG